ncbi:hypothetical protein [Asticcacaulis sp. MM231]|uniref:hypothetical protein n=1 Tax=Asticcacaulis sp. MM231 TaxID=3157666 RepID=UPI0032D58581
MTPVEDWRMNEYASVPYACDTNAVQKVNANRSSGEFSQIWTLRSRVNGFRELKLTLFLGCFLGIFFSVTAKPYALSADLFDFTLAFLM